MPPVPRPTARARAEDKVKGKTPPEGSTTGTPRTPESTPTRTSRDDVKLRESVKGMYEGVALLALGVGLPHQHEGLLQFANTLMEPQALVMSDGQVVVPDPRTGADKIADAWMTAADRNPRIKQALKRVTEGGALAEVAALHITLILPFLPGIPGLAFLSPSPPQAGTNGATPS